MSAADRYADFTKTEIDVALQWLSSQGAAPWASRLTREGGWLKVDTRGMPPLIRQMLREQFDSLDLMTRDQVQQMLRGSTRERIDLVDQVLTETGR